MGVLVLVGLGAAVWFMYNNYKRNKRKIEYNTIRIEAIEKHLGITPPPPPPKE